MLAMSRKRNANDRKALTLRPIQETPMFTSPLGNQGKFNCLLVEERFADLARVVKF